MSFCAIPELGPPGIHSVVMARGAAQKIKELSSNLFADRLKLDQGGFAVTFTDDPANPRENSLQSKLAGREQERRFNVNRAHANEIEQPVLLETHKRLDQGEGHQRRRSVTVSSSGFSEHLSDSDLENASPRRRRHTTVTRPPKTVSSGVEPMLEPQTYHTYRLEPQKKFEHWKAAEIIKKVFEECLTNATYDVEFCRRMNRVTADSIMEQVKSLQFSRYKIIAVVSIGQKVGQSVRVASSFVWDPRFDCYAQYAFEKEDIYAFGVVYGIYYE